MQKYKIIVSYDGTHYHGWQEQKDLLTVTNVLQDTFYKVFDKSVSVVGASRTDAGVHAHGQVARFCTDLSADTSAILFAWNNALPDDILITSLSQADESFHPFHNVIRKTYYYHVFLEQPLPFVHRYGWFYSPRVDISKFNNALKQFIGTHDFTSFCSIDTPDPNKVRTIDSISIEYVGAWHAYRVTIVAKKFLRYMIRRMVGAALKIAVSPGMSVHHIGIVLGKKNPNNGLPTAAAQGLTLHKIEYDQQDSKN